MSIIARRIPHPLAGASDCGPNQQWDPNYVMPGLPPGQCTPKGSPMTPGPTPGFFDSFMSAMFPKPAVAAPTMVMPVSQGMSQGTMIALGLGAVGLLAIVLASRSSATSPKQNPARSRRSPRRPRPRKPRLAHWILTWVHDDGSMKTDAFTFTSKSAAEDRGDSLVGKHGIVSYRISRASKARQFARKRR